MTTTNDNLTAELLAYERERIEVFLSLDLAKARDFFARHLVPTPDNDHALLTALHKARYECREIPTSIRIESGEWLLSHGYGRLGGRKVRLFEDFCSNAAPGAGQ